MNDIWSFNVSSGYWTWLGGSSDINLNGVYTGANAWPGGRYYSSWSTKPGFIYMFGGFGFGLTGTYGIAIFLTIKEVNILQVV